MQPRKLNVLFLCTGNSARSIMAEALLNHYGASQFNAFSAGSCPTGQVHPMAIHTLEKRQISAGHPESKHWDIFATPGAPSPDFVITVCDNAAGEICPLWPGQPVTAHWGVEDPAAAPPEKQGVAFASACNILERRIRIFVALPFASLSHLALESRIRAIGMTENNTN